jgi:hypothetical protein
LLRLVTTQQTTDEHRSKLSATPPVGDPHVSIARQNHSNGIVEGGRERERERERRKQNESSGYGSELHILCSDNDSVEYR